MELDNVDGVEGKLKVWIRRVWTLEMVSFTFALFFNDIRRKRADIVLECHRLAVRIRTHESNAVFIL